MKITDALKKWLVENGDVKSDATDDEFRKAAGDAMASGKLTAGKLLELTEEKEDKEADEFGQKLDGILDGLGKLTEVLAKNEETPPEKNEETPPEKNEETPPEKRKELSPTAKMIGSMGGTPVEVDGKDIDVRVKEAAEMYSTTKTALMYPDRTKDGRPHPLRGRPVRDFDERGHNIDEASDRDLAIAGAYAKFSCQTARLKGSRTLAFSQMPQHDKELLLYGMDNYEWGGATDGGDYADIRGRKLTQHEKQSLIDDAVSGGLEAAPIVFDDMVIQVPLLHGELFPSVNVIPIDRGRRIEGSATGTVTRTWGGIDNTAIPLFNTANYVTAFDTTIHRWEGSIQIGLDFLSDTPIDFAQHVTAQYGEGLLEDLDDVIATGNGATEPTGITVSAGTTVVNFGGVTTLGAYEALRFSVPKNEHKPPFAASAVFCGTEVSYTRAVGIPVGAADVRRIFGMKYDSYSLMERPYKINESLANTQIFYAIMARYRMYRRRGLTMRSSTEGRTLIRANNMLIAVTARYGGQIERGAVAGVVADAPA